MRALVDTARAAGQRLRRRQDGMTIVEAMVAGLILVIGSIGVLSAVDTASRSTFRAEQSQVEVNALQQELERIRQLPFAQVALTGVPQHAMEETSPNWRVSDASFALRRDGTDLHPLVVDGEGGISPEPTAFQNGDVQGEIYRYVVWLNDETCPESLCPGDEDIKRVVVAALLDETASGGERAYQEIHADLTDPDAQPVENPAPEEGPPENFFWEFWLTDTPCDFADRQPIVSDHDTHNTLGRCDQGLSPGPSPGAPDLMLTEPPPLEEGGADPSQYDYADDVEPESGGDQDKGLQLMKPSGLSGCLPLGLGGLTEDDKRWKVHRWLSPEIPDGFEVLFEGHGTLELWTQTIGGAVHRGEICAWLFTRQLNLLGNPVDTPVVNLDSPLSLDHFPYAQQPWPSGTYQPIEVPVHFAAVNGGALRILPGTRLGLAIAVHRNGTADGDGLQFMYDHPSFESKLQLKTVTPVDLLPF